MLHCDADPQIVPVDVLTTPGIIAVLNLEYFVVEGDAVNDVLKKGSERC